MTPQRLPLQDTLRSLPPEWAQDPLPVVNAALQASDRKIVVLDDDVMGTQSVHDIAVLMDWSVDAISAELSHPQRAFFIVTNARSMPESQAQAVNAFIARNLTEAARRVGVDFAVVSRLDSTLRGHFPAEMLALQDGLTRKPHAWIIAPIFVEGGRCAIGNTQYVSDGECLTPVGETEFARDAAFAFKSSDLRQWVEEKTAGAVSAANVVSVSIEDLRLGGPAQVAARLSEVPQGGVCVVNGASNRDMEVFTQGLLAAEADGKRFLFRAAASFIRALLGQSERAPLTPSEMGASGDGGALIVVGSHVPRTTRQLNHLLANANVHGIQADVNRLLASDLRASEIERVARAAEARIHAGEHAVVHTSRALVQGRSAEHSLAIGHQISQALAEAIAAIGARPRYMLVKGGATSADVASKALNVQRAWSPGQAAAGVPVWILGAETLHPRMPCIIFPGNVGAEDALTALVARMDGA